MWLLPGGVGVCVVAPEGGNVRGCSRGMCGFIWGGMCGFIWGARVVLFGGAWFYLGGHVWFYLGGMHGFIRGACMVFSVFSDTMRYGQ